MKLIIYMSYMIMIIIFLMTFILNLISKKSFMDREKNSPFECGFDPKNSARLPFSLHFFLIATIFLIFDVEITLLLPMVISMNLSNIWNYSILLLFFLSILLIGIYHEWNQGALTWLK